MALSAVLKQIASREGRCRGARDAAWCLDLRAGRARAGRAGGGAQGPFPRDPHQLTLPRAEQKRQDTGAAHGEPGRRATPRRVVAEPAAWGRAAELERGRGAQRSCVCVRLLVRPLASPHRDRLPQKQQQRQRQGRPRALLIYPDPGNDVIGTAPAPSPSSRCPGAGRSTTPAITPSYLWPPPLTVNGPSREVSNWFPEGGTGVSADPAPLHSSTDWLCIRGQVTPFLRTSCSCKVC